MATDDDEDRTGPWATLYHAPAGLTGIEAARQRLQAAEDNRRHEEERELLQVLASDPIMFPDACEGCEALGHFAFQSDSPADHHRECLVPLKAACDAAARGDE